jgi:hypothetical protein
VSLAAFRASPDPPANFIEEPRTIPNRSRTSFQKRQKELARMEKQKDKAARKAQRKAERGPSVGIDSIPIEPFEDYLADSADTADDSDAHSE